MNWNPSLVTGIVEIGMLVLAALTAGITIVKMNASFRSKLEEHKTYVLLLLKEHEVKINTMKGELVEMRKEHDRDLETLSKTVKESMKQFHDDNRTDHSKIFDQLREVGENLAEVKMVCKKFE